MHARCPFEHLDGNKLAVVCADPPDNDSSEVSVQSELQAGQRIGCYLIVATPSLNDSHELSAEIGGGDRARSISAIAIRIKFFSSHSRYISLFKNTS